jgi:hypothetical protein
MFVCTFHFPSCLSTNTVCRGAQIRSSRDEIERVVVVLVKGNGLLSSLQTRRQTLRANPFMLEAWAECRVGLT